MVIYPLRTKIIKDNKERNAFLLLVLLLHLLLRQLFYNLSSCTRLSLFCVCIGVSVGCVCLSVKISVKKSALKLITKKDLKIKQFWLFLFSAVLFFCTIARELFFFRKSRKNLTFRRINHASSYTKVYYYGHTRFNFRMFLTFLKKIRKLPTKQCAKLTPSKGKIWEGNARCVLSLSLSHTFCVLFICCSCCFQ